LRKKRAGAIQRTAGEKGTRRHLLADGRGVPLLLVVAGANRHDVTQLELLPDAIGINAPEKKKVKQNLCAGIKDKRISS
jgi:hypothetical protein